ncbi:hypothetical protein [Psychroserpens jangbogonensis]|nr:hypothetical protein [Psychroserpens jangbogonensis]
MTSTSIVRMENQVVMLPLDQRINRWIAHVVIINNRNNALHLCIGFD